MRGAAAAVEVHRESTAVPTPRLGMWLFLASEVMFFGALVGSYLVLRLGANGWPDPNRVLAVPVLAFNTFVLIASSACMVVAHNAAAAGDMARTRRFLLATAGLGTLFLAVKVLDYVHLVHEGFVIGGSLFASCYYLLTGFHGLHVLAGVIALLVGRRFAATGRVSAARHGYVEGVGLYWHFVDVVWIVLFAILCLL
jgi:heme/copper-type cytochrome/quinol oxidase subunit 3